MNSRTANICRETKETQVRVELNLDGTGRSEISTGIGILDHLWETWSKHSRFDLSLSCSGDLHVDDHHTAEDCALVVGQAFDRALGERRGIARFGLGYAPMDEALVRAVVDLSGRPFAEIHVDFSRPMLGALATENIVHAMRTLSVASNSNLHVDLLRGENDHHRAEACFKAMALAYSQSVRQREGDLDVPSTKGRMD